MEFYSENRLKNWIRRIEEVEVSEDDAKSFDVFDQMVEDVVVSCMNIIRAVKEREIKKSDAIKEIEKIENLFSRQVAFGSEIKDIIYQFTVESIKAVLKSFEYYLEGKSSKKSFEDLIREAVNFEAKGDLDDALDAIARMGAKVLNGENLPELELESDGIILSWLDGVDSINTVLELSKIDVSTDVSDTEE